MCEFCGNHNTVDLAPEEVPAVEDTTYLKTPAPTPAASSQGSEVVGGLEDSLVVFCVDVSGSMCQTVEVSTPSPPPPPPHPPTHTHTYTH